MKTINRKRNADLNIMVLLLSLVFFQFKYGGWKRNREGHQTFCQCAVSRYESTCDLCHSFISQYREIRDCNEKKQNFCEMIALDGGNRMGVTGKPAVGRKIRSCFERSSPITAINFINRRRTQIIYLSLLCICMHNSNSEIMTMLLMLGCKPKRRRTLCYCSHFSQIPNDLKI